MIGLASAVALFAGGAAPSEGTASIQVLALKEWFGVTHPEQIVEFVLDRPARTGSGAVVDEAGKAVPFQLLEHGRKLAMRTALEANSQRTWRWFADRDSPVSVAGGVEVKRGDREWEIANAITAVRVPLGQSIRESRLGPALLLDLFNEAATRPAFIRYHQSKGYALRDSTWSGLGANVLVARALKLLDARTDVVEAGPLKTVVQVRYEFEKPVYMYGQVILSPPDETL
jgi:hypothetical protein